MPLAATLERDLYAEPETLPENRVGEIIGGELHTQPRPAARHGFSCVSLASEIYAPFQRGRGGPGGWWITVEPEMHFVRDTEVLVPDIAGWRRERMPRMPEDPRFEVVPDWVCEILSPSTALKDRAIKMPVYTRFSVAYLWLVDPIASSLETFALENARWVVTGQFKDDDLVATAPFKEFNLELESLWAPPPDTKNGDRAGTD